MAMYSFDKRDMKALQRRLNRKIGFGEAIPNNMRPKRPNSRVDLSYPHPNKTSPRSPPVKDLFETARNQ